MITPAIGPRKTIAIRTVENWTGDVTPSKISIGKILSGLTGI